MSLALRGKGLRESPSIHYCTQRSQKLEVMNRFLLLERKMNAKHTSVPCVGCQCPCRSPCITWLETCKIKISKIKIGMSLVWDVWNLFSSCQLSSQAAKMMKMMKIEEDGGFWSCVCYSTSGWEWFALSGHTQFFSCFTLLFSGKALRFSYSPMCFLGWRRQGFLTLFLWDSSFQL